MANVVGEGLDGYVNNQINQRQLIHGKNQRTRKDIQYLNNRNAWVKLASGVFLENTTTPNKPGSKFGQGMRFPMKYVLFNGITEYFNEDEKGQLIDTGERDKDKRPIFKLDSDGMAPSDIEDRAILAAAVAKIQQLEDRIKELENK